MTDTPTAMWAMERSTEGAYGVPEMVLYACSCYIPCEHDGDRLCACARPADHPAKHLHRCARRCAHDGRTQPDDPAGPAYARVARRGGRPRAGVSGPGG